MKTIKIFSYAFMVFAMMSCANTGKILNTANDVLKQVNTASGITQDEAGRGLKEALANGTNIGVDFLSKRDGFFKNNLYKILLPPEAQKMEQTLRNMGLGSQCDRVIENINRGAELAVSESKTIFLNAITSMSISDAIKIVTGGNGAGTNYLRNATSNELYAKFSPIIQNSLDKVEATKYWKEIVTTYNKIPTVQKINPDLNAFVTNKAMDALFNQILTEENKIREDPVKRGTDLLRKVFGYADQQKGK